MSARTGKVGENIAREFLLSAGMELLEQNFRAPGGEVDLIMREGGTIVFVEVKTRVYAGDLSAYQAIDAGKRARISKAALYYINSRGFFETACRFDAVIIIGQPPQTRIDHYKNAFMFSADSYFV
ncbi:MAG: YraN family protein [Christensenellales bacterium]